MNCSIEGDGGSFTISQGQGGSVTLRTQDGSLRLGGEGEFEFGGKYSDDNVFVLHGAACRRAG